MDKHKRKKEKNEVVSAKETAVNDIENEKSEVEKHIDIKAFFKKAGKKFIQAAKKFNRKFFKPLLIKIGHGIKNVAMNFVRQKTEDNNEKKSGLKEAIDNISVKIRAKNKIGKIFAKWKIGISGRFKESYVYKKDSELLFVAFCINVLVLAIGKEGDAYLAFARFANNLFSTFGDNAAMDKAREFFEGVWKSFVSITPFLMVCGLLVVMYKFIKKLHDTKKNERFKTKHYDEYKKAVVDNSEFRERIFAYLEEEKANRCLIVTGEWGSGKTYQVNKFFEEYEKYNNMRKYTISCFAIESREQLTNLLQEEMKAKDDSFQKKLVSILEHIPFLGELIASIYDGIYSINFLKKDDVIVLEDVERVTFSLPSESKEVYTDADRERAQKISIIAGFTNDLLERHKNKVILVCNRNEIKAEIFNDILYSKLASEIITVPNNFEFIFDTILEKYKDTCSKEVFGWSKIVFGIHDTKKGVKPICEHVPYLFSLAGIKNIRDIEKVIGNTVLYFKMIEKIQGDKMNISKGEIRLRAEDFIYSFVLYHILTELHISLSKDHWNINYTELCLEDENLRNSSIMRKVCMEYPIDKLFVSLSEVESVISHTYGNNNIDIRKYELKEKQRDSIKMWKCIVKSMRRESDLKFGFEEIKYHIYAFMYLENRMPGAGVNFLTFPDLDKVGVDDRFEENIPKLLEIVVNCASVLKGESRNELIDYIKPLHDFFNTEGKAMKFRTDRKYNQDFEQFKKYLNSWSLYNLKKSSSLYQSLVPEQPEISKEDFAKTVAKQRETEKEKELQETNNV